MHIRGKKSRTYLWSVSQTLAVEEFPRVADRPHLPMGSAVTPERRTRRLRLPAPLLLIGKTTVWFHWEFSKLGAAYFFLNITVCLLGRKPFWGCHWSDDEQRPGFTSCSLLLWKVDSKNESAVKSA